MIGSKIQWTDATVNFWMGCSKVSQGCKFCYMHRMIDGKGGDPTNVWRTSDSNFYQALRWEEPRMIFTCSMSDFFIQEADKWRKDAWDVIRNTPHHIWQILTKRPERIEDCLPDDWGDGWDNVHLGVTVENQDCLSRASILSRVPAKVRFISAEPLLEEVDFLQLIDGRRVIDDFQWLILGGESGNNYGKYLYRPCEIKWLERAIGDLKGNTDVAVFDKQLGTHLAQTLKLKDKHGGNWDEWPEQLRIREYPSVEMGMIA